MKQKKKRSALSQPEARKRYVVAGELVVLEQVRKDAAKLDDRLIAVGPFGRLDASSVAVRDGKTRGAITNLFGSQAAFQIETMALSLSAGQSIDEIEYPQPGDFATDEVWADAFFTGQAARGPRHGSEPITSYSFSWALWLSALPYGLWSESVSRPSMEEFVHWVKQLEGVIEQALDHFGMVVREDTTINDFASAVASMIEGAWLNQCLTTRHPFDGSQPIATLLRRSGLTLWRGATQRRAIP